MFTISCALFTIAFRCSWLLKALGAHDFGSAEVTKMSDTDLITIVTAGKNKMPAYGKSLKDTEIKDPVAYVRELGKQKWTKAEKLTIRNYHSRWLGK